MLSKIQNKKAVCIGAAAVVAVILFLIILFAAKAKPNQQQSIILPPDLAEAPGNSASAEGFYGDGDDSFIAITKDNVHTILLTLSRPIAYHQTYEVTVGPASMQRKMDVELWVNNGLLHAEVSSGQQMRSLITDGTSVHMWYGGSTDYVSIELEQGITVEDLLGFPDFDSYLKIPKEEILETGYQAPEDSNTTCVYVSAQDDSGKTDLYWVNLENGLLFQANAEEDGRQVYSIRQTGFDLLAIEDESFTDRFILPDGNAPFIAEAKTPQP